MYTLADKQRGGTVLGLIIGLIIGLGIAVAVALAITKSSLPFTNKGGRADKSAEMRAAAGIDPNKSLYGNREPAREAAKAFNKENKESKEGESKAAEDAAAAALAEAKAVMADKPKKSETADAKPESKAESKGEAKNDIKLAKADTKPASDSKPDAIAKLAAEADTKSNTIYFLQAGAFRDQNDAESVRAKLALMGFEARISERPSENGALYRVRIGPVSQLEAMNKIRTKLSENGVDASVIRTTKQ